LFQRPSHAVEQSVHRECTRFLPSYFSQFLNYALFIVLEFLFLLILKYSTHASHKLIINTFPKRVYEDDVEELLATETSEGGSTAQGPPAPDEVPRYIVCSLFTVCFSTILMYRVGARCHTKAADGDDVFGDGDGDGDDDDDDDSPG
jgi:hypothetical protein